MAAPNVHVPASCAQRPTPGRWRTAAFGATARDIGRLPCPVLMSRTERIESSPSGIEWPVQFPSAHTAFMPDPPASGRNEADVRYYPFWMIGKPAPVR